MTLTRLASAAALLLAASLPLATPALAQDAKILVPTPSRGIEGCWHADRTLYGPYQLRFCLDRGTGSYQITGGGMNCRAGLHWHETSPGRWGFTMSRSHCGGRGFDWTADSFTCHLAGGYQRTANGGQFQPKILVPTPSMRELECRYQPAVSGYGSTRFSAHRG